MSFSIDAAFDSGNIRVVAIRDGTVDLEIVRDHQSDFYQWFHFRVAGVRGQTVRFRIVNAGGAAYAFGWPGYRARASVDRRNWRMIDTHYDNGVLSFDWTGESDLVWFAYFAPYTMEMHADLIARTALQPGFAHRVLGHSLEGQAIDAFRVGTGAAPVWLYARQHPGESMAEWWMDGALAWLATPAAGPLLERATLHIVPNMNPDGTRRGHLRTNAAGVNLNREWHAPSPERSPEVLCVRDAMDVTGVAWAIDVHGDEAIPANFLAGFEGIPGLRPEQATAFTTFAERLAARTPDFQTKLGYEKALPGKANLAMSTNQLAERFGAVAMTLEMPFKDHDAAPDPEFGWSPQRSQALAVACLETLAEMLA